MFYLKPRPNRQSKENESRFSCLGGGVDDLVAFPFSAKMPHPV